jgi:hypothetical protein
MADAPMAVTRHLKMDLPQPIIQFPFEFKATRHLKRDAAMS